MTQPLNIASPFGFADRNHAGDISAGNFDDGEVFVDPDMESVTTMDARLDTISSTLYSAINLASMTFNDKEFAIRSEDFASTI